jgi:hypothetical protein
MNNIEISYKGQTKTYKFVGKAKIRSEVPKSYKELGVCGHNWGNSYNSDIAHLFLNKKKHLILEIYRDGCFNPYYIKIEEIIN